jgi:anti-anti-sigma regulatory factor
MLFDLYQLTHNRTDFDGLSMLFTVKFERSPPVWAESAQTIDPRRKEKRERKDFFPMTPAADGALLGEIDKFEEFATEMGSCRIGLEKVASMLSEEAELFSIVFQRMRRAKIPIWFNGFDDFAALLKKSINEAAGQPLANVLGYWSLLFELYILDGKLNEYEELGLEYAVAFEMSPPPWEVVVRPTGAEGAVESPGAPAAAGAQAGFPLKGVVSANSKDMLQQLSIYAASRQEVLVDMSSLMRIDFAIAGQFFEAIRAIHLGQKRVILANLNELTAALLEVFGMTKHAILMRKKAA